MTGKEQSAVARFKESKMEYMEVASERTIKSQTASPNKE